ncbi:hypothetical protein [Jiulongibacter sediminis]|uniref:hypothetical protein n=1 Tax=Jiulongibacter sediminis TaxID=1605367 RepID=UPI0026EB308E|nr:hypothetical protein [Jiulongibacter sediminis]
MKKDQKHTEKTPFKGDSDYFKHLEDSILSKVEGRATHLSLDVDHPFKADSEYFAQFEKRILDKTERSVFHLPLGIEHPFQAPEGYFQKLESSVLGQAHQNKPSQSVFTKIWRNSTTYVRAAAVVLAIGAAGYFFLNSNNTATNSEIAFADFETETLVSYLENQELDMVDFASIVDDSFEANGLNIDPLDEVSEDELLQLIDLQYANDI